MDEDELLALYGTRPPDDALPAVRELLETRPCPMRLHRLGPLGPRVAGPSGRHSRRSDRSYADGRSAT